MGWERRARPFQNGELYEPVQQSVIAFPPSQLLARSPPLPNPELRTPNYPSFLLSQHSPQPSDLSLQVVASFPADGTSHVPLDSLLALRFSPPLAVETVNAITVALSDTQRLHPASVVAAEDGMLAFLLPQCLLRPGTTYTLTVNGLTSDHKMAVPLTSLYFTTAPTVPPCSELNQKTDKTEVQPTAPSSPVNPPVAATPRGQTGLAPGHGQTCAPLRVAPGVTALSGHVVMFDGTPLARETLRVGKHKTRTGRQRQFLLKRMSASVQVLEIEEQTANRAAQVYGRFEVGVEITPQ